MTDVLVARFDKNRREVFDVRIREFKGHRNVDFRVYAENSQGEFVPTSKGVSIKPGALRDVIRALYQAEAVAVREGILEPEG